MCPWIAGRRPPIQICAGIYTGFYEKSRAYSRYTVSDMGKDSLLIVLLLLLLLGSGVGFYLARLFFWQITKAIALLKLHLIVSYNYNAETYLVD